MIDDFRIGKTLGQGYSAKVKLAIRAGDDKKYALKILKLGGKISQRQIDDLLVKEDAAIKQLKHRSVVRYYGCRADAVYSKKNGTQ